MREGIDYMSLNVNMNTAWRLVFSELGHQALGVLFLAHQIIYAEKGYYLEWNSKKALLLTLGGNGLTADEATKIIEAAVYHGVFDQEQFEKNHILTSQEIQNHYFQVVRRRKNNGKTLKYLLSENEETEPELTLATIQTEQVVLPENLDAELENFAPLGEEFSILPNETNPKEVFLAYQKYCPDLEKALSFTADREDACKELLKKYTLKQICVAFKAINDNPWNQGENKGKWLAGIDYCLNPHKISTYLGKAAFSKATEKYRNKEIPEHTKKAFEAAKKYAGLTE